MRFVLWRTERKRERGAVLSTRRTGCDGIGMGSG